MSGTLKTNGAAMVLLVARNLVDEPSQVQVEEICGAQCVVIEVRVAASDVRRLIGVKGRTVEVLRQLLHNVGSKEGQRYVLEIIEP